MKLLDDAVVVGRGRRNLDRLRIVEMKTGRPLGQRDAHRLAFCHFKSFEDPVWHLYAIIVFIAQLCDTYE